jgi:hypothetical protein
MAKPDKTDLLNASVARSMKAWAKATIDLDRARKQSGRKHFRAGMRAVKLPSVCAD